MVQVAENTGNYFGKDDHGMEVTIVGGVVEESKSGSQFVQLGFEADDKEGNTGYNNYITEKALPYTAARFQSILVHNETTDEGKDKVREDIAKVADDKFGEWIIEKLIGKKAYLAISFSDNINEKTGLPYLQKNLQGYPPAPLKDAASVAKRAMGGGEEVTKETLDSIPF